MSLFSWSVWPANRLFSTSKDKTRQNSTALGFVSEWVRRLSPPSRLWAHTSSVWWGKLPGNAAGSTTRDSLWSVRCCTLAIFHDSLLQQGHQRTRRALWYSAGPAGVCGGRAPLSKKSQGGGGESWLKRGVIWRLVTENDWALADRDNDSLRAKHRDGLFCFLIPRNLPSICLTPGKVETPGNWAELYRTESCDISVNISVSC